MPDSVGDVRFYVPPYMVGPRVSEVLARMSSLEVVQTLTAGVDNVRAQVPDGVTLCNGRGIHDTSTAELALTLILASLRGIPDWVRAQDRHEWQPGWRPALADKRVLLVGYGAIGEAIERRLLPFEVEVVRVARTARDGVHAIGELPRLLPERRRRRARRTPHRRDPRSGRRGLPGRDAGRRPAGQRRPRAGGRQPTRWSPSCTAGRLRAAVDVVDPEPVPADHPFWDAPGLLVSPHVGGASSAMWPRAHRLVRDQLHRYAAGEELVNVMSGDY